MAKKRVIIKIGPRAGKYGEEYSEDLPKHDWETIITRITVNIHEDDPENLRWRRMQLTQARNFAYLFKKKAERKEAEKKGSGDPAALAIDTDEVDRLYLQGVKAFEERTRKLGEPITVDSEVRKRVEVRRELERMMAADGEPTGTKKVVRKKKKVVKKAKKVVRKPA